MIVYVNHAHSHLSCSLHIDNINTRSLTHSTIACFERNAYIYLKQTQNGNLPSFQSVSSVGYVHVM